VTTNDIGNALILYYFKVVDLNRSRRERLIDKVEASLLGGDYPGIQMTGLPRGLRLECSVSVVVLHKAFYFVGYFEICFPADRLGLEDVQSDIREEFLAVDLMTVRDTYNLVCEDKWQAKTTNQERLSKSGNQD
jgi:hypothetical protein